MKIKNINDFINKGVVENLEVHNRELTQEEIASKVNEGYEWDDIADMIYDMTPNTTLAEKVSKMLDSSLRSNTDRELFHKWLKSIK